MKPYTEYYDWYFMLLEVAYFVVFAALLWTFSSRMLKQVRAQYTTVCAFAVFVLLTKIAAFSGWFPYFPDTQGFAMLIEDSEHSSQSLGVKLYYVVSTPLRLLALNQIELYLVVQQFLFMISIILVWKSWTIHANASDYNPGRYGVFVLMMVLYPSIMMFVAVPLREFLMVFGFSLFLYGLTQYLHFQKMTWLLLGSVLTIFIRPQLVVLYPLLVVVAKQKNYFKLVALGFVLLILVVPLFEAITGYRFTPEFFAFLRERGTTYYAESGMTYGAVEWNSYFDMMLDLPSLFLQFVLSPLPILHNLNPLNLRMMFIDLIFVLFVFWGVLWCKLSVTSPYLKMFLLASLIFSVWEFYIGGAVRHRMPLIIMIMPIACCYYTRLAERIVSKMRIGH